jgi:hypothetical protein
MGARPMQRLIQDTIRRALADELLFGRLTDGGRLTVDLDDKDEVVLDIQPLPKKEGRSKPEYTPLAWASHGGHTELVALLIGKGAELNAASRPYAFTPLMNAAQNGHTAVVRALLEAGAEVHRETSDARNALSMAQRARKSDVVLLLEAAGSHLPAPLPVVPVIPWSDGGPAAVLRDFIRAMNRWEIDSLATIEADPQAGGDVILAAQQDVFALYCTDRKRPYGRQGSFGSPPTYDPAEVLIGQAEPRKLRAELTTRHGEREYFYVALCKKGLWRLDSKRQRHIGGDWFDDVL